MYVSAFYSCVPILRRIVNEMLFLELTTKHSLHGAPHTKKTASLNIASWARQKGRKWIPWTQETSESVNWSSQSEWKEKNSRKKKVITSSNFTLRWDSLFEIYSSLRIHGHGVVMAGDPRGFCRETWQQRGAADVENCSSGECKILVLMLGKCNWLGAILEMGRLNLKVRIAAGFI